MELRQDSEKLGKFLATYGVGKLTQENQTRPPNFKNLQPATESWNLTFPNQGCLRENGLYLSPSLDREYIA